MDGNFTHLIYNIQFPVSNVTGINGHMNTVTVNTTNLQNAETVMNFSVKENNVIETHTIPAVQTTPVTVVTTAPDDKNTKRYACEKCSLVFKHKEMHRRHMNVHAEKFKCMNCGKCFQSNYYLVRHHKRLGSCELILRQQRQNYNVQCPMCDFKTTSKVNLRSHLIKHTDKNQCKVCKHTFLRQRDLQTHNKSPVNCNKYLMM